jgi:hypothetical protein
MIDTSIASGDARYLFMLRFMSTVNEARFTTTPTAPTAANFKKVLLRSNRIHHAFSMNSMMSDSPSFVSPRVRSTNSTGTSCTTAWFRMASWSSAIWNAYPRTRSVSKSIFPSRDARIARNPAVQSLTLYIPAT